MLLRLFLLFLLPPQVDTWQDALAVENASPYGNAASIYTSSGPAADFFQTRFRAGMIGEWKGTPWDGLGTNGRRRGYA